MQRLIRMAYLLGGYFVFAASALAQTVVDASGVHIQSDGRVLVANTAVIERAGVPGVFLIHAGRARFRMVKTGGTAATGEAVILSGLKGNETVILHPERLTDGMEVGTR